MDFVKGSLRCIAQNSLKQLVANGIFHFKVEPKQRSTTIKFADAATMSESFVKTFQGKTMSSAEFVGIFRKYDLDGNGFIEKSELDSFLKDLQKCKEIQMSFEELKTAVMSKYDVNSDNKLSMEELSKILPTEENFLAHFRDANELHISDFMKIWYHYDQDKSGYLESNELQGFLRDLLISRATTEEKQELTAQQIHDYAEVILDLFDRNNDGKIELCELSKILRVEENFLKNFQNDSKLTEEEFEKIFSHYDQDGNGYIEDTELIGFLRDLLQNKQREPTTTDLEQYRLCILEISDTDKDGKLSKNELKLLLLSKSN